ncbi:MAG: UvrD-helicase domain-containing protein [Alphaproteobacteria bacterium]
MSDPFDLSSAAPIEADPAPVAAPNDYLAGLNEAQREAVATVEGPLLVLAGAGTGKTRVLTTRLAHILLSGLAWPNQVLAVTFTNKAAREMIGRVGSLMGRDVEGLWLGTFHAIAARMLRRHAELVGLKSDFTIIDTDDQIRLLKQVLSAHDIDDKRWPARGLLYTIERWKDRGLTPDRADDDNGGEFANGRAIELYRAYQARLSALNAADFGDLMMHCLTLFTSHPDVLERWQSQFRYILVDEYQDTNVAQYLWLRLLAQAHGNLCCVGDDDQSIYSWRGAEVANILKFEKDFPSAVIVRLERNYRSTGHILGAASGLIANNADRLGKTLFTDSDNAGDKVTVQGMWDGDEEARVVGEEIEALHRNQHQLTEMAVLVRAGFQTRAFEERFITIGLPYRVVGGLRFYERQEIRDAIAYMRVTNNPDNDLSFERIVNLPKRGLGDASLRPIHQLARSRSCSLSVAARLIIETDELRPKARGAIKDLVDSFDHWRRMFATQPHAEVVGIMLDESGYTAMWQNDKSATAPGRLENLKELVRALEEFENLAGFLEHVSLVMDIENASNDDMVNIMTLHSAKGLEFDTVFLPGWEEGLFPHELALQEKGEKALEEERRLAYVGLTRARKRAAVMFAANRRVYNQWKSSLPSRFVDELPDEHVERRALPGVYGGLDDSAVAWNGGGRGWPRRTAAATAEPVYHQVEHEPGALVIGVRIFHQKFGYGRVVAADGNKLDVAFDKAGNKKVLDSFVKPA